MAKKAKKSSAKKSPRKSVKKAAKKPSRALAKKTPKKSVPSKPSTPAPRRGDLAWTELNTSNPAQALSFYQKLFGWKDKSMPMGPDMTYIMLAQAGKQFGGIAPTQDPSAPSQWLTYFWADNVDKSTESAKQLGATVLVPPMDIPGTGRMSVLQDPTGASFALFYSDNPMP